MWQYWVMCHFVGNFFLFHHQMKLISWLFTCSLKIFIHSLRSSTLHPRQQAANTAINVVFYLIDRTWMLAHWIKSCNNQSAIFLPAFRRSIRILHNADSKSLSRGGAIRHEHWMNIGGLPTQSTTASWHKFRDRGYDDVIYANAQSGLSLS